MGPSFLTDATGTSSNADPYGLINLWWILILVLTILTAFFSGAETAIESCNQFKFKVKAGEGSRTAKLVIKIINKFDEQIISVLVGYNIVTTIISTVATIVFSAYLKAEWIVNLVSTIVITILIYIFGDTLPKIVAKRAPDTYLTLFAYPLMFFYYVFYIVNKLFYYLSLGVKKLFKIKKDVTLTEEDFSNFVDEVEEDGKLDEDETDIILNSLDFLETDVKQCFTPANKMEMIDIDNITNEMLNGKLLNSNFSRMPVYKKDKNNIVGILTVKKYFNEYMKDKHVSISSILSKPYFVDPNTKLDDLFEGFNKFHTHIAIVKNKNIVVGMVTMDDLLEELVGQNENVSNVENKEAI